LDCLAAPLDGWLSAAAFAPASCRAAARRFAEGEARMVVIDDVLLPSRYRRIADALKSDVDWSPRHGVVPSGTSSKARPGAVVNWVGAADFAEAQPKERFFKHQLFERALAGRELSPGILDLVRFKALLSSSAFLDLADSISGCRPNALQELLIRRMVQGDVARPHHDAIGGRTICALLYFSDGWTPAMGGQFVMHTREGDQIVDPLPNRMILFDVNNGLDHSVRPLSEVATDFQRFNLSIWFR
jgi:hypothetical protein